MILFEDTNPRALKDLLARSTPGRLFCLTFSATSSGIHLQHKS